MSGISAQLRKRQQLGPCLGDDLAPGHIVGFCSADLRIVLDGQLVNQTQVEIKRKINENLSRNETGKATWGGKRPRFPALVSVYAFVLF